MIKRSVSLAITNDARPGLILLVQRPDDDAELPGLWGLPAASLAPGEDWNAAALRAGTEKLGVDLTLGPLLQTGTLDRDAYRLHMRLIHATVGTGTPSVPQIYPGVTQYQALRWALPDLLGSAAAHGSLCARLCLDWVRTRP